MKRPFKKNTDKPWLERLEAIAKRRGSEAKLPWCLSHNNGSAWLFLARL
jgi:hypothetical protein